MNKAVIVQAKRTPIGRVGGMLKDVPPEQLASVLLQHIVEQSQINPKEIDDVILGNTVGPGGNLARLSLLTAGLPIEVPGVTVDRQCGSGLEAINLAARLVQSGAGDIYLAGGLESTSLAPWKMEKPHTLYNPSSARFFSRARFSTEEIGDPDMGVAAENVAEKYQITRQEQDRFSLLSHQKAVESIKTDRFHDEIVPISVPNRKGPASVVSQDECPRPDTSLMKLSGLAPVFRENGTVTAGNSCPINDGAAIALVMSEKKARSLGLKPMLTFIDSVALGVDPNLLGIGPVPAVHKLLQRNQLRVADLDIVEFNEAFASQVIASLRELQIPWEKVNLGGGAIALGHPYGASGAILVTRLVTEMRISNARLGLATMGIGGGLGVATLFERF